MVRNHQPSSRYVATCQKLLCDQIAILGQYDASEPVVNCTFVEAHAREILTLCRELRLEQAAVERQDQAILPV